MLGIFISTKASLKDKHPNSVNIITQHLLINYILTYLLVLFFSITFFDASITLDERILSPVFVIGLILIFSVIYKVSNISGKPVVWKACILVFLVFIYINALPFRRAASDIQKNGEGFASLSWQQSASIRYLKSLPKEILIYTNAPDVAYILTGKYASSLPNVDNRVTTVLNPTFISEMDKLKNDLSQKDTYVLFFNNLHRDNIPTRNDLVNKYHFPVLLELADGTVFGIGQ